MGAGRVVATCASMAAVGGCALLVVQLSSARPGGNLADTPFPLPTTPAQSFSYAPWPEAAPATAPGSSSASSSAPATTATGTPTVTSTPAKTGSSPQPADRTPVAPAPRPTPSRVVPPTSASAPAPAPAPVTGQALPVAGSTSGATRVITVQAAGYSSTTATLQAWDRAPGGGWLKHGGAILAHVGSQGLTTSPSETKSATPIGSFTLTQAFGANSNPGTPLPYFRTTSADWWISQSGPLYNTHQHCSAGCNFTLADPNEHLAYELPYYNYAVVIDYNTPNSPTGVQQGRGSAFFLHVTDGSPTAGCVAIPQSNLVSIMQWLAPAAHPRILIGVRG